MSQVEVDPWAEVAERCQRDAKAFVDAAVSRAFEEGHAMPHGGARAAFDAIAMLYGGLMAKNARLEAEVEQLKERVDCKQEDMMSDQNEHRSVAARLRFLAEKASAMGNMVSAQLLLDEARREDERAEGAPPPVRVSSITTGDKVFLASTAVFAFAMLVALLLMR